MEGAGSDVLAVEKGTIKHLPRYRTLILIEVQGDVVEEGRVLKQEVFQNIEVSGFFNQGSVKVSDDLFYNQERIPPTYKSNCGSYLSHAQKPYIADHTLPVVFPLCTVRYRLQTGRGWFEADKTFTSEKTKRKYCKIDFELLIVLGNATLEYKVRHKDQFIGNVQAEYMQKFAST